MSAAQRPDSLALDRRALEVLDGLLVLDPASRGQALAALQHHDAVLDERVRALLAAEAAAPASLALAGPLAAALDQAAGRSAQVALRQPGQHIGPWRLVEPLGRGGMSAVWLAERAEGGLTRKCALKLPLAPYLGPVLAERFAREREVLATLDHPNIARLYDAGVAEDGQPWIAMERVEGRELIANADAAQLSTRARLLLFEQVLAALAHAHRHLVVHRDIKPQNVLVDGQARVKLLDFGIAKLLEPTADATSLTQEGTAVLTPRYAAPEQVLGQLVGTPADVYGAGVLLYELLCGRSPYPAEALNTMPLLMEAVVRADPDRPGLGADLDTVILKALRKAPEERYASIEHFADDLRRLREHRPILARPVPLWERALLLVRRQPRATAMAGLASIALLGFGSVALWQYRESNANLEDVAAVRGFVFQMVADVEPVAGRGPGDVTGREIVAAAVHRAQTEFADRPALRGHVLVELARIQMRLGQGAAAQRLLDEALPLLAAQGSRSTGVLSIGQVWQASLLLGRGQAEEARRVAEAALNACQRDHPGCAKARSHAHATLRNVHVARGDSASAVRHAQAAVNAARQAFPDDKVEQSASWQALAVVARNAAQFELAGRAIETAATMAQGAPLRAAEAVTLERTRALIALDLGQAASARARLEALLPRVDSLLERALQHRLLALASLAVGDAETALTQAREGARIAEGAQARRELQFALQTEARALMASGQSDLAATRLAEVRQAQLGLGYAALSPEVLRTRRLEAEARLLAGQHSAAAEAAAALVGDHETAHAHGLPTHAVDWALAEELLGTTRHATGEDGASAHRAAGLRLAAVLPGDHPLLLNNRLHQALAERKADTATNPDSAVTEALRSLRASQHRHPLVERAIAQLQAGASWVWL